MTYRFGPKRIGGHSHAWLPVEGPGLHSDGHSTFRSLCGLERVVLAFPDTEQLDHWKVATCSRCRAAAWPAEEAA